MAKVKVIKKVGTITSGKSGNKEINIVEWQEGYRVVDIRKWQDGEAHKGISLNLMEAEKLYTFLGKAIEDMKTMMNSDVEEINFRTYGISAIKDEDLKI